ncbi:5-dehydro-4-deoxyglucarate dehydratase [Streptomyces reniochalinae]|uniref:Probable 5-dehydro-4-deoxyglucarate dehydratase n=1 Tax=Streptomyces reniochalinae TaxID=2250578 RepID=A0A367EJS3_9ACTN|nr:5-dehydro-4-deoxyglucarate dehydratase [Streptomyces reniochalinae]RCG17450.1 5-dehydro-4-deoxyglucarate dehydratase [Streptomyces reniochalinae]
MAQPPAPLEGLLAFPLTPFSDALSLDLDAFAQNVERHVEAGAGALFVACGTGEFSSLSPAEHAAVLARAREVVRGRVPVWVGAGGGAAAARAGVAAAADGGADGVLLLPPYLVSGPPDGLVDFVRYAVADTSTPVIVYHRSTGVFTESAAVSLLDVPSVVGLKDGFGDVELMHRIVTAVRSVGTRRAERFWFFNGLPTAEVSAHAYSAIGVTRYSSAVHCFAPEIAHRFHRALAEGDSAVTQALLRGFYLPLVALRNEAPGFAVSLVKAAARLRGDGAGPVRPPLVDPTEEQTERLRHLVEHGYRVLKGL